jgi:hypothetical protein
MNDTDQDEEELKCLESMHKRVAMLRTRLKILELDTYSAIGITEQESAESAKQADGVSKNYT